MATEKKQETPNFLIRTDEGTFLYSRGEVRKLTTVQIQAINELMDKRRKLGEELAQKLMKELGIEAGPSFIGDGPPWF